MVIRIKSPYALDELLEENKVDGLTLTYFLSKSKEFSMQLPKYIKHTRGGNRKKR
jgi:hypothetical protein